MQITISAVLAILVLSLAPFYNGYSTTDDEEGIDRLLENGAHSGESEDGTEAGGPTVNIDPSSSDSLSVVSNRISTDEIFDEPTMNIDGEIQNNGTESLDFVRVTATFYDATNSILGSDFTFTEPTTLESGQTAPFKISAGSGDNLPVDEIASIKLHVGGR